MPIIRPTATTAPVFFPEGEYVIVKYMDFTKFISLLSTQSLFFCRVDKLEDQFEGTLSEPTVHLIRQFFEPAEQDDVVQDQTSIDENINDVMKMQNKFKTTNCVNCWNIYENNESAALWKIYSDFSKGIMIKSSIRKLIAALETTEENIGLSEIQYIDHRKDQMGRIGNLMESFNYKYISYSYEKEIRLIYDVTRSHASEFDWSKEEIQEGLYLKTDINQLIDEIIISPHSPKWFLCLVQDICEKYKLEKNIKRSDLAPN